ncbi:MAG TPA: DUF885 family protein, partial [Telluria sp.]|nr:DUF885 family protein [Telluria sp.]
MRRLIVLTILCAPLAGIAQMQSAAGQAHALFERDWEWRLRHQPELATTVGDHRFDDSLSDTTTAACRAAVEHERDMLSAIRAIDRDKLAGQDRISWDLFVDDKERKLATAQFSPCDPYPVTFLNALPVTLPRLVAQMPLRTEEDYRRYLARIGALPRHVDGLIEQMRDGMRTGWTAPKAVVRPVPAMLREMREGLVSGALAAPFRAIPATIDKEVREEL